ncbi:LysM peptidoglycan-binding domain-containing protein [Micrococcus luteus]
MNARTSSVTRTGAAQAAGWRLNRRGRFVLRGLPVMVLAAVLTALAATALSITLSPAAVSSSQAGAALDRVVVMPGDSLWDIAGRVDPQADRFETMETISDLNGLEGRTLETGEDLFVPAFID